MSGHTVETDDENSKVISQTSQLTLALHILKLVSYFNSIIISNQIKYYLAIIRCMLFRFTISHDSLLLKEYAPRAQCLEPDCL